MAWDIEIELKYLFIMLVSGGRAVGKIRFTKNILRFRNQMIPVPSQGIVRCCNKHPTELFKELISISPT